MAEKEEEPSLDAVFLFKLYVKLNMAMGAGKA